MGNIKEDPKVDQPVVVPVVAEEMKAGVRSVPTGGIRINKRVGKREEIIDQPLRSEHIEVRRVVRNEVVSGPLPPRQEGDTLVVPVVKEVLKIEKQLILTEELYVTKRVEEKRHVETVILRHEHTTIDRIDGEGNFTGPFPAGEARGGEVAGAPAPVEDDIVAEPQLKESVPVFPNPVPVSSQGISLMRRRGLLGDPKKVPERTNRLLPNK